MRQEEARMRRNKMTRCSRKNGERLNPKAKQSWMAKVTPGDSGTWSGKSSCRQPCRISDVSAKSHLEEVGTPSRQSNGMYSSGGRVPGYVQESWQAEKGRETELLTYRGKTKDKTKTERSTEMVKKNYFILLDRGREWETKENPLAYKGKG